MIPFNIQKKQSQNPTSQLPKTIREAQERERQGITEPELSPEEIAKKKAELKELLGKIGIHREDLA